MSGQNSGPVVVVVVVGAVYCIIIVIGIYPDGNTLE